MGEAQHRSCSQHLFASQKDCHSSAFPERGLKIVSLVPVHELRPSISEDVLAMISAVVLSIMSDLSGHVRSL